MGCVFGEAASARADPLTRNFGEAAFARADALTRNFGEAAFARVDDLALSRADDFRVVRFNIY